MQTHCSKAVCSIYSCKSVHMHSFVCIHKQTHRWFLNRRSSAPLHAEHEGQMESQCGLLALHTLEIWFLFISCFSPPPLLPSVLFHLLFFSLYHISPLYNHKFQKFSSLTNNCITSWYFVLYFQNPINLTAFGLLLWKVKHARSCRPFIIWLKVERN